MKYVMYRTPPAMEGSIGIAEALGNVGYTVTWNAGKDIQGKAILSVSFCVNEWSLVAITKEEYEEYTNHRAWSDAQSACSKRIVDRLIKDGTIHIADHRRG